MNLGDLVQITRPSVFETGPTVGTVVRLPLPGGDRLHHQRVLVQVGTEMRPRPVLPDHLKVLGRSETSLAQIEEIWRKAREERQKKLAAIEKSFVKPEV